MMKAFALTFALVLICSGAVLAQTPDGQTPAEETVCDNENGAAFGLCNAYCEAMDCESDDPQASATACTKVRDKFMNIAGHDLPCEASPCPCANLPGQFARFLAGEIPITSCTTEPVGGITDGVQLFNSFTRVAFSYLSGGNWYCGDIDDAPGYLSITPEQGQFCAGLLEQAANSQSVSCVP
jgi:hypothetical protein